MKSNASTSNLKNDRKSSILKTNKAKQQRNSITSTKASSANKVISFRETRPDKYIGNLFINQKLAK